MKQCPKCSQVVGIADKTINVDGHIWHLQCYGDHMREVEDTPPDPLERIAAALERIADRYEKHAVKSRWPVHQEAEFRAANERTLINTDNPETSFDVHADKR